MDASQNTIQERIKGYPPNECNLLQTLTLYHKLNQYLKPADQDDLLKLVMIKPRNNNRNPIQLREYDCVFDCMR